MKGKRRTSMSLARTLERWGIKSELTHDQAALLGHEDATTGQQAGQHRISANNRGMLAMLGEQFVQARKPIEERITRLRTKLEPLGRQHQWAEGELATAIGALDKSRAEVRVLANRRGKIFLGLRRLPLWIYLPLMLVFVVAELILNSAALQIIGESDLAVFILAGTLVVAMLVICHYIGEALYEAEEDPSRRRRLWWLVAAAVLILLFLWAIGGIRVRFLNAIGISGDLVGAYLLQLPVIAAAVIAAYLFANHHAQGLAQRQRALRKAQRKLAALENARAALQGELRAAEANRAETVQLYLDRAPVVQEHSRGLQADYTAGYAQTNGEPPTQLPLEPAQWTRDWTQWLNQHADDSRPTRGGHLQVVPEDGEERKAR
jgi:hypothetical protein